MAADSVLAFIIGPLLAIIGTLLVMFSRHLLSDIKDIQASLADLSTRVTRVEVILDERRPLPTMRHDDQV